jgi:hypothetical protein
LIKQETFTGLGPTSEEFERLQKELNKLQSNYDTLQHFLIYSQRILLQMADELHEEREERVGGHLGGKRLED